MPPQGNETVPDLRVAGHSRIEARPMNNVLPLTRQRYEVDRLVVEMMERLPVPGSEWPVAQRIRWLRALAAIFDMLYETDCPLKIEIQE